MTDPVQNAAIQGLAGARPAPPPRPQGPVNAPPQGADFQSILIDSLNKVDSLQQQADEGVQKLVTGQTDNVAEVLAAVNKAGVAFDLLMEVRNKLSDAYEEIKQMRV